MDIFFLSETFEHVVTLNYKDQIATTFHQAEWRTRRLKRAPVNLFLTSAVIFVDWVHLWIHWEA